MNGFHLYIYLILTIQSFIYFASVFSQVHHHESKPDPLLLEKLKEVAGIYKDKSKQKGLEKAVMITSCNHAYLNHLHNYKCFADRLGFNFLVMSMDPIIHQYITQNTTMVSYLLTEGAVGNISSDPGEFRSRQFNMITAKKVEAVYFVLDYGYDVLFADVDIAVVRDPIPHVIYPGMDYVHSTNSFCELDFRKEDFDFRRSRKEGNTGFYFVRSTSETVKLWEEAYEATLRNLHLDDQATFWTMIRHTRDPEIVPVGECDTAKYNINDFKPNQLTTCWLDSCMFSAAMISKVWLPENTYETLKANVAYRNKSMITIHANYIKGNRGKMLHLLENGLWIAVPTSIAYPPWFNASAPMAKTNQTIDDELGNRFNLEHVVLAHTHWGKCREYVEY